MAKSLSSILSQIERLQKEAASIQSEVLGRIRKDIAKYSLTAEQLFGEVQKPGRVAAKPASKAPQVRAAKYADGAGNTWGGMGKRPDWLRQALEAGKAIQDFLIGAAGANPAVKAKRKSAAAPKVAAKTRAATKKAPARKARKASAASATE